ncbi:MAG: single-stranded DNA-binding protein [Spirochaetota bacterium]
MANDTNVVIMTGRPTRQAELQTSKNGRSFCKFALAVNLYNGVETSAHYFNWIAWGKTAEYFTSFINKGDLVIVEGEARQNIWTDKEGVTHYEVEFFASNVKLMRRKAVVDSLQPAVNEKSPVLASSAANGNGHDQSHSEASLPLDEKQPESNYVLDDGYNDDEVPF